MSSIPEDFYLEILKRVPVKSTFVCKCVCKNWLDLISSPKFVKIHLDFNIQKKNYNLMLNNYDVTSKSSVIQSISNALLSKAGWMNEFQDGGPKMDYQFNSEGYDVSLRSLCHGVGCLVLFQDFTAFLCLWNPATNEYKKLPQSPNPREDLDDMLYRFELDFLAIYTLGYDYKIYDYKLVKLLHSSSGEPSLVYVYTLGLNSWKYNYKFTFGDASGVIVSGAAHWLVKTLTNSKAMVSFDIIDETFEGLQLPEELLSKMKLLTSVGDWEECLCLLVDADNFQFDVWVLQEYGVQDSWSKHFSITLSSIANVSFLRLLWSFKNGKILLMSTSGGLVLYDLENEKSKTNMCSRRRLRMVYNVDNYVESLVALNSGTYVGR